MVWMLEYSMFDLWYLSLDDVQQKDIHHKDNINIL